MALLFDLVSTASNLSCRKRMSTGRAKKRRGENEKKKDEVLTGTSGRNKTHFGTSRTSARDRGSVSNVLMVTTTVGMLHRVHGHTTDLGPRVALHLVLAVGVSGLEQRLVDTSSTSHETHSGARIRLQRHLVARRQTHAGNVLRKKKGKENVNIGLGQMADIKRLTSSTL